MFFSLVQSALDRVPLSVWLVIALFVFAVVYWFAAPIINTLWAITPKPLKIALGALAGGLGIYIYGRTRGAANERELQKEKQKDAVQKRTEIDHDVKSLDDAELDKRFDKWVH